MKTPKCPMNLSESARGLWRSIHAEFELTASQRGMVLQLCEAIALADAAKAMMRAEGLVVSTGTGMIRQHPASNIYEKNLSLAIRLWRALGFSKELPAYGSEEDFI